MQNFTKILPVVAELFNADERAQTDMTKLKNANYEINIQNKKKSKEIQRMRKHMIINRKGKNENKRATKKRETERDRQRQFPTQITAHASCKALYLTILDLLARLTVQVQQANENDATNSNNHNCV
jgi:Xaa-Pro aminopeptidase